MTIRAKITDGDYGKKIVLSTYLRKDYVDRSLVIKTDFDGKVIEMMFLSNNHGVVEWVNGKGLTNCRRWENEDMAKSRSYLTSRYTTIMLDGEKSLDFGENEIIPDVLSILENDDLADYIRIIVRGIHFEEQFRFELIEP